MLILLSLSSAVVIIPESVLARLFSIKDTDTDASIGERLDIWKICIEAIGEKPVLGYGPGVQNSWDIIIAGGINAPHAHNLVLQLLIEGGIVGLALMLFLGLRTFFVAVRLARHSPRSQETRMLGILFAAFVLAFCVDSMVEYPFLTPKLIGTFVLVLAMGGCHPQRVHGGNRLPYDADAAPVGWPSAHAYARKKGAEKNIRLKIYGKGCYFLRVVYNIEDEKACFSRREASAAFPAEYRNPEPPAKRAASGKIPAYAKGEFCNELPHHDRIHQRPAAGILPRLTTSPLSAWNL